MTQETHARARTLSDHMQTHRRSTWSRGHETGSKASIHHPPRARAARNAETGTCVSSRPSLPETALPLQSAQVCTRREDLGGGIHSQSIIPLHSHSSTSHIIPHHSSTSPHHSSTSPHSLTLQPLQPKWRDHRLRYIQKIAYCWAYMNAAFRLTSCAPYATNCNNSNNLRAWAPPTYQ
jgi:hypothetical protein